MLDLERISAGTYLMSWNSELPSSSTGDPLGMTLRIGARLGAELLHCITSITPRARYYSFFPWAFARAQARLGNNASLPSVMRHVLIDERAMVLGAVLHHDGKTCDGGALQGSSKAAEDVAEGLPRTIDLAGWMHLGDGVSGFNAYKGSLINLGVFEEVAEENGEESDREDDEVGSIRSGKLSQLGLKLADAFAKGVEATAYAQRKQSSNVAISTLDEFGSAAGLCELRQADGSDLESLRQLFFASSLGGERNSHGRRSATLYLILWAIGTGAEREIKIDEWSFADLAYFDVIFDDEGEPDKVAIPAKLQDIAGRWRIFQFHNYLTAALEGLLAGVVREIRNYPSGRTTMQVLDAFDSEAARKAFSEFVGKDLEESLIGLTPAQSLELLDLNVPSDLEVGGEHGEVFTGRPFVERELRDSLIDEEMFTHPEGPALCALLLYALLLRYGLSVEDKFKGWNTQKVYNPLGDVGIPTISSYLESEFGKNWWHLPNRQVLKAVLDRFVIRQHETMSYEKGVGGSPPFFRVDGFHIVGTDETCNQIGATNPRFRSALQVLWDLRLIDEDEHGVNQLTPDGSKLLSRLISGETA